MQMTSVRAGTDYSKTIFTDAAVSGEPCAQPPKDILCPGNTFVVCVRLADGRVQDAWSTGRMMRNMNVLLQGSLDAEGAPQFMQQAHCLCNDGHALAAVRALEDLAGFEPPRNAVLMRSLVQALRCIQENLLHVYQFRLSDWVCLAPALRADPQQTAQFAGHPEQEAGFFRDAQERLQSLSQSPELFGGSCKSHPDYQGPDALHLTLHAHALDALHTRALLNKTLELLGCGSDGYRAYQLGGLPEDLDLGSAVRDQLRDLLQRCRSFVSKTFLPDLELLSGSYAHWANIGAVDSFLSWGDFALPSGAGNLFPQGIVTTNCRSNNGTAWQTRLPLPEGVTEDREPAWSAADRRRYRLQFDTDGPRFVWGEGAFHWLSAPRHAGEPCETGPLARVLAGLQQGREAILRIADNSLCNSGFPAASLNSTLGRVLARGIESAVLAQSALDWLDELETAFAKGDRCVRADVRLPSSGIGTGRVEVPRGALSHTIRLEDGRIAAHDYLIPSVWNFSPRDAQGKNGPLEQALLGTPVDNPDHPLEILRTLHELDPCNACHLVIEHGR